MKIGDTEIAFDEVTIVDYEQHFRWPKLFRKDNRYSVSKGKHSYGILPLYCGFDIETTNVSEVKSAFMYMASFSIATSRECIIYHFRTWNMFTWFLDQLSAHYELSDRQHIVCYVANLSYEFTFMCKRLEWSSEEFSFFAKEHRKPLLATTSNFIEFREALSISGGNLDYLSQHFTTTRKAVGDLDYTIPRNSHTPLTETEMRYVNNDVIILSEFSYYILEHYVKKDRKFPLTKTGTLRSALKIRLKEDCSDFQAYQNFVSGLYPSFNDYLLYSDKLFRGGYVHANIFHVGDILEHVWSFDETSAYPTMMLLCSNYPVSAFMDTTCDQDIWTEYCLQTYACILDVTFSDIYRTTNHSIESSSKCLDLSGEHLDNGRVKSASSMRVLLTELDFQIYKEFYSWSDMKINSLKIAKRGKLPRPLLELLKEDYKHKDFLKHEKARNPSPELERDYAVYKGRVNSWYGLTVTKISMDNWKYLEDGWKNLEKPSVDYEKETAKSILSPFWGYWVTANARHALLMVCKQMEDVLPDSVIYNDTDSIKCIKSQLVSDIIDSYNDGIQKKKADLGLTDDCFFTLGTFELEEEYDRFKTLGAKRYLSEHNGKVIATIAGFPKSALLSLSDPFTDFSVHGMNLTPEQSMKKTAYYNDTVTDSLVDGERMTELSSVYIYDIPFTMSMGKEFYINILENFEKKGKKL